MRLFNKTIFLNIIILLRQTYFLMSIKPLGVTLKTYNIFWASFMVKLHSYEKFNQNLLSNRVQTHQKRSPNSFR
jgi:hypothetical protein